MGSMFKIGDKVVHPYHGAGKVVDIEEKMLLSEGGRYYVIDLVACNGIVMVPTNNIQKIGLRRVSGRRDISRAMNTLISPPDTLSSDHRERQAHAQEKLNTGDLIKVTEVVRNLAWRNHEGRLTMADNKIYQRAQTFLASELSLARGVELQEAMEQLQTALND
ncbi:MAG: CarD family transcriptional regulator [Anaerolineales bacterium]|nr:CarD family transcriptional regulator [Anaerolineales bacterium]